MTNLTLLKITKPYGYKYYSSYVSKKGLYAIYSRDGKRYYIDAGNDAMLFLLPDTPFSNSSSAKKYLEKRIKQKSNFPILS